MMIPLSSHLYIALIVILMIVGSIVRKARR
jgi:hypothetical protein